jgi:hypothetical protein
MTKVPESLRLNKDSVISIDLSGDLGFYPHDEYLLVEITNRIRIYDTRKLIAKYSKEHKKPIAIRGIAGGLTAAVVMTHLIVTEEDEIYSDQLEASTFSVRDKTDKPKTGIQLVIFPKESDSNSNNKS